MIFDEAFAGEVRANPNDDTARLILADYLSDSGNPMGELIRIQLELSSFTGDQERRIDLEQQEAALLGQYGERWLQPLRELGVQGVSLRCFRRGLIERIRISVDDYVDHHEQILALSPGLSMVQLTGADSEQYSRLTFAEQIKGVDLSNNRMGLGGNRQAESFLADWMGNVETLVLDFNLLRDQDIQNLTSVLKQNLKALHLGVNQITPIGLEAILNSASYSSLEELSLNMNDLDTSTGEAFSRAPNLFNLQTLNLASNQITNQGLTPLLSTVQLPSLKRLNVRSCGLTQSFANLLNQSTLVEQLETIDLRNNGNIFADLSPAVLEKAGQT